MRGLRLAALGADAAGGHADGVMGAPLAGVRLASPFLLRTVEPPLSALTGKRVRALRRIGKWTIEIVKRSDTAKGFVVLPRRWVVERTLAWLNRNRRLAKDFEQTMRELQTLFQQYKQIEQGLQQNRIRLGNKLPEIKRALDTVKLLKEKSASGDELDMDYELTDSVFAKAKVKDAQSVYLWLGANVMLEYSLDDAENLLQTNHENCARNLATNKSDLAFVKDNVTITEVSIARVYNWDVKRRKAAKEAENK